ncbi:hypothetical protein KM043_012181 [Ampulex compressa]|nr:hypothetical protein KM043_012181 [Ampulex compressa]
MTNLLQVSKVRATVNRRLGLAGHQNCHPEKQHGPQIAQETFSSHHEGASYSWSFEKVSPPIAAEHADCLLDETSRLEHLILRLDSLRVSPTPRPPSSDPSRPSSRSYGERSVAEGSSVRKLEARLEFRGG